MASSRLLDDGSSQDLVNVGSSPVADYPVSIAVWFKSDDITVNQVLVRLHDTSNGRYLQLVAAGNVAGDPIRFRADANGPGSNADTTSGYSADTWHLAVGVGASSTSRAVYIDGGSKGTDTNSEGVLAMDNVYVGSAASGGTFMSGNIVYVAIWDIALSDADVVDLWNGGAGVDPRTIQSGDVVASWFDGTESDVDNIGSADLTPNNGPTWDDGDVPFEIGGPITVEAAIAEGVELSDTPTVIATLQATVTDGMALGDNTSPIAQLLAEISEGTLFSDEPVNQVTYRAELTDGVVLTDTIDVRADLLAGLADGAVFSDSTVAINLVEAAIAEGISLSDTPGVVAQLFASLSDGISLTDAPTVLAQLLASISEGIKLTDIFTATEDADVAVGLLKVTVTSRTYSVSIEARVPGAEVASRTPGIKITPREE